MEASFVFIGLILTLGLAFGFYDGSFYLILMAIGFLLCLQIFYPGTILVVIIALLIIGAVWVLAAHFDMRSDNIESNQRKSTQDDVVKLFCNVNGITKTQFLFVPGIIEREKTTNSELQYVAINRDSVFHYSIAEGKVKLKKKIALEDIKECQLIQENSAVVKDDSYGMQSNIDRIYIKLLLNNTKEEYQINILNHPISKTSPDYELYDDVARKAYDTISACKA